MPAPTGLGIEPPTTIIARKYLYLIALARERHFGKAASACHISLSTLSAAIRDLETELGVALVERGKQFSWLTPEGRCVVEHAQRMVASAQGLSQELTRLRRGLTGRLTLGVIPTALTVVASLDASFSRRYPMVRIRVLSLSTDEIFGRLARYELDAGVVYVESGESMADLLTVPLWRENHVLISHVDGPFEGRDSLSWREAADLPLCLLTPDMHNRKTIDAVFARMGTRAEPTLETNSIVSMLAHVCSGAWSAIVPRSVLELIGVPAGVRTLPLVEPVLAWATGLVVVAREPRSPIVEALLAEARSLKDLFGKDE